MNRHTLCKLLPTLLIALTFLTTQADAGLVISFGPGNGLAGGPVSLVEGQAGKLNVLLRRDNDANTPALESFTVRLNLTPVGDSLANGLLFADPQQQSQLSSTNYVFDGNSFVANSNGGLSIGNVQNNGSQYTGTDLVLNTAVALPQTNRVLFTLDLTPVSKGNYQISVNTTPNATSFIDSDFNPIPFSHSSGTITVTAVPEPSSIALLIASIGAAALPALRRKSLNQK
jgi:hypothetical protein